MTAYKVEFDLLLSDSEILQLEDLAAAHDLGSIELLQSLGKNLLYREVTGRFALGNYLAGCKWAALESKGIRFKG